jgi:TetR/AcrR family transcriptional regulator
MSALTEPEKKILEAAKHVFEKHGFDGARMQQIADETGISKASLHYYFRSKEKLFDHIFEETMTEFLALVSTWEDDTESWEAKLRRFIQQFFNALRTKSLLFILREINRNPDLLIKWKSALKSGKNKNRFIRYFETLKEQNLIEDVDVTIIFIFLHSLCAYPVLNEDMFKLSTQLTDKDFDKMMNAYPDQVADFLIQCIRKKNNA